MFLLKIFGRSIAVQGQRRRALLLALLLVSFAAQAGVQAASGPDRQGAADLLSGLGYLVSSDRQGSDMLGDQSTDGGPLYKQEALDLTQQLAALDQPPVETAAAAQDTADLLSGLGYVVAAEQQGMDMLRDESADGAPLYNQGVRGMTQQLVVLSQRLAAAAPAARASLLLQLEGLAAARQEHLAALIESNPAEALTVALPEPLAARMPAEVRAMLEEHVSVDGELQIYHVHSETDEGSRYRYYLNDTSGRRIELSFVGSAPQRGGATIIGRGLVLPLPLEGPFGAAEEIMAVQSWDEDTPLLLNEGGGGGGTAEAGQTPELSNTIGEQRTVVLVVNFQDDSGNKPWTLAEISQQILGETSDFMSENSYGRSWLVGDVFGWYTIALDSSVCDNFAVTDLAEAAAIADGVDLSVYDRFIYLYPPNACGVDGTAEVGTFPSKTWISRLDLRTAAHEIGHNLGLFHAHYLDCGDVSLSENCSSQESGDTLDVLGATGTIGHFNAFEKELLGWLGFTDAPPITAVTDGGIYDVAPYSAADSQPKALKIVKDIDPVTGARTWYYIEFRQPVGFDAQIAATGPASGNVFEGIALHLGTEGDANSSYLLDMTPGTDPYIDQLDPTLVLGQSYDDPDAGVTVTTDWIDSSLASVNIALSAPSCVPASPLVDATPNEGQWVAPGTAVVYGVTVTNGDNASCPQGSFDLSAVVPAGWSASWDQSSLSLVPGASASADLTVTSPAGTLDGFYDVDAVATNATEGAYSGGDRVTYVVNNPVNAAPVAVDDGATVQEDGAVTIVVLNNDSDPDGDPLSVVAVVETGSGSCTQNADGSLTYTPGPDFFGTDVFSYTAADGQGGSDTALVTVTVLAVNDAPLAGDDSAVTAEDTAVTLDVLANDSDPEADLLNLVSVTQGSIGSVADNGDGTVTYSPDPNANGSDSFSYTLDDGQGGTDSATVTVTVTAVNDPPVAIDDVETMSKGKSIVIAVLVNDSDPDGDPLAIAALGTPANGTVVDNGDGTVTYTPAKGFNGEDVFTYEASDGAMGALASVTVTVAKGGSGSGNRKGNGKPK